MNILRIDEKEVFIVKVKVKCSKCSEKHYIRVCSLKVAKSIKKSYKESDYTCGKCLGYKLKPYTGILAVRYLV